MFLNYEQHKSLCNESYYVDNDKTVDVEIIQRQYQESSRHEEHWNLVFKLGDKFYKTYYSESVKDTMGWYECNHFHGTLEIKEVFPVTKTIITYELPRNNLKELEGKL